MWIKLEDTIGRSRQIVLGNTILDENVGKEKELLEKRARDITYSEHPSMLDGTIMVLLRSHITPTEGTTT
jgi:hypothetical protein